MAVKMRAGGLRKAKFTSQELDCIQAATGKSFELVRGELYEVMPPNPKHGRIAARISRLVDSWAEETSSGEVYVEAGWTLERSPDTVRGPDVSFTRQGRLSDEQASRGFPDMAPDLAVEVRSPNETWRELDEKAREYFAAGCRLVWLVEMDQFLEILWPNGNRQKLGLDDAVEVDDVLPGFRCNVRDFFPNLRSQAHLPAS
ncbi:MAG: Uma2 family endonuclease [Chloroflexota bacterium]